MEYVYKIENDGRIRYYTTGLYYEFVYSLDGIPYKEYDTDPRALVIYEGIDRKKTALEGHPVGNGRRTGIAVSTDVWDIIIDVTGHVGIHMLEWEDEAFRMIHKKYPNVSRLYANMALSGVFGGLGKDFYIRKPEKVMLMREAAE